MSIKLSLKEARERLGETQVASHAPFDSLVRMTLKGASSRPVELARLLTRHGLTLKKAHQVVTRLAEGTTVPVELHAEQWVDLVARFKALGIEAQIIQPPAVSVRDVRQMTGLSQAEFATRFGFELDTVQNWEQGRHAPDTATLVLLKIISEIPEVVDSVLTTGSTSSWQDKAKKEVV
jgi:DNA-binding transcriptional regulator YiaG